MNNKGINEKLMNVQTILKVPKNNMNTFGNYKYRSCEDILESLKPILNKFGLVITISDHIELVGDRYYVVATALLEDTETNESKVVYGRARESEIKKGQDDSQITGSASSYARKYALNGMFAIDDTKDADFNNKHDKEEPTKPTVKKATKKQIDELTVLATPEYLMKVKEFYINNGVNDLLNADYETIQKAIEKCKADVKV